MLRFDPDRSMLVGPEGTLHVPDGDEVTRKLAMLIDGECMGLGGQRAAEKYGFCKQRYYQLLGAYEREGAAALKNKKRGPKKPSRRTDEVVRQIIRHRFLDPDASIEVITQKLCQCGFTLSARSVRRVIDGYGLQKKTLRLSSRR
jgi:transposase